MFKKNNIINEQDYDPIKNVLSIKEKIEKTITQWNGYKHEEIPKTINTTSNKSIGIMSKEDFTKLNEIAMNMGISTKDAECNLLQFSNALNSPDGSLDTKGFLYADGSKVSKTEYEELFEAIDNITKNNIIY